MFFFYGIYYLGCLLLSTLVPATPYTPALSPLCLLPVCSPRPRTVLSVRRGRRRDECDLRYSPPRGPKHPPTPRGGSIFVSSRLSRDRDARERPGSGVWVRRDPCARAPHSSAHFQQVPSLKTAPKAKQAADVQRVERETYVHSHKTHGRSSYRAVRSVSSPERARATEGGTHGTTNGRPSHTPFLVEKCMGTQVMPFGSVLVRTVGSPGASRTDAMMSR